MTLAHQPFRVYKNLDEFHDWPLKYRHWHIEVAENGDHEIWVATESLRHIYPLLPKDDQLKAHYHSAMFYVKEGRRHYISERSMRLALNRARRGIHETEVLRFLEWFDKNVSAVVAKKRERAHLDRINEIRDEHAPRIAFGPIPRQFVNPDLEASTLELSDREHWAAQSPPDEPPRVFRPEAVPIRTTWGEWMRERASLTLSYLFSFWRGERNVFLTAAFVFVLLLLYFAMVRALVPSDLDPTRSYARLLWAELTALVTSVPLAVWIAVSLTRSTRKAFSITGGKFWATPVWVLCIPFSPYPTMTVYDPDLLEEWWEMVRGKYSPAWIYADKELGRIVIKGEFKFGSAEALEAVMKANPRYTLVEINSPGGFVLEGFRMAGIISDRKMDTVVQGGCASACTFLLAAGQDRYIGAQARVGFHRSGSKYLPITAVWSATDHLMAKYYASRGASEEFIRKALAQPITGIWIAPHHEMYAAGYATAPWSERKSGY